MTLTAEQIKEYQLQEKASMLSSYAFICLNVERGLMLESTKIALYNMQTLKGIKQND